MTPTMKPVSWRPEMPDGTKFNFNCCLSPDVYGDGDTAECRNCGYDWSHRIPEETDG